MRISFDPASLTVATGKGKTPAISLRSFAPITSDTADAVEVLSDGQYSVKLSPGQSEHFAALMANPSEAFTAAIIAGSLVLPDAAKGRKPAKGVGIVGLLGLVLPDPDAGEGDATDAQSDGEAEPDTEPDTESTVKQNGRQRRS